MLLQMKRAWAGAAVAVALMVTSSALIAQQRPRPLGSSARGAPIVTPQPSKAVALTQRTARSESFIGEGGLFTNVQGTPLLSSFRFSFNNGDHKLRRIGLEPQGQIYLATYADQQPDDPFRVTVTVWDAVGETVRPLQFVTRDDFGAPDWRCWGFDTACTFAMPASVVSEADAIRLNPYQLQASHVPILSGFYLDRADTDANVLALGIGSECGNLGCRGWTGLADTLGVDLRHTGEGKSLRARRVLARATYALVPRPLIKSCHVVRGSRRAGQADPAIRTTDVRGDPRNRTDVRAHRVAIPFPNAKIVLKSMRFEFGNGDHHLVDIGVEYEPAGALYVTFSDNDRDDPYSWMVEYCVL